MFDKFNWEIFWNAISAISTFLAVLVSLWLAKKKKKKKITLYQVYTESKGYIKLTVTINNIGDIPVGISNVGFLNEKKEIDNTCQKFLTPNSPTIPFKILAGDLEIIEFEIFRSANTEFHFKRLVKQIKSRKYRFSIVDSENKLYK